MDTDEYYFLMIIHHINCDGLSLGILIEDLYNLYRFLVRGNPMSLPELNIQYADYAAWENNFLKSKALQVQLGYWKDKLGIYTPILNLPFDHPEPEEPSFMQASYDFILDRELVDNLKILSKNHSVTLFMTLLAAFKAVLYEYSTKGTIQVGTMFANRHRGSLSRAMGLFSNNVILRSDLNINQTFTEIIEIIRDVVIQAQLNKDVPFEVIANILENECNIDCSKLCQIAFNLEIEPVIEESADIKIEQAKILETIDNFVPSTFDLECNISVNQNNIQVQFQYSMDRFENKSMEKLANKFILFLRTVINNTQFRLSEWKQEEIM